MTRKLYYEDASLLDFQASLLSQRREGDRWLALLDRTAFYPEGGGAPADRGWLNGLPVLEVRETEEGILHALPSPLETLPGLKVTGSINEPWRRDYMQQHSGQHIVSASLLASSGADTVSMHLGEEFVTVEVKSESLSEELLAACEDRANGIVTRNLPILTHWVKPEEVGRFRLRRPPPARELLRIVEIQGADTAACGGLHCASTGEVGLIKAVGSERIRGRLRLYWKIGARAYRDYRDKDALLRRLTQELSCPWPQLEGSVQGLKGRLQDQARRLGVLEESLAELTAESLYARACTVGNSRCVLASLEEGNPAFLQLLVDRLQRRESLAAFVALPQEGMLHWAASLSPGTGSPLWEVLKPLLPLIEGKGGGREGRYQGIGRKPGGLPALLAALEEGMRRSAEAE